MEGGSGARINKCNSEAKIDLVLKEAKSRASIGERIEYPDQQIEVLLCLVEKVRGFDVTEMHPVCQIILVLTPS